MIPATIFSRILALTIAAFLASPLARADVRLPKIFGSHMVLQQGKPIIIWGWANPGETATVRLGEATHTAVANDKGEWKLSMPAMKAGGPHTLAVKANNEILFENVMVGEVWVCSGQSNMEMGMKKFHISPQEIAAANHPGIRLMLVENKWTPRPQNDIEGTWKVCTPQTIAEGGWDGFSATGYYFGREIHQKLGVAVGLIDADWGGTRIESWTPPEGFAAVPALKDESDRVQLGDPKSEAHQQRLQQTLGELDQWHQTARVALQSGQSAPPAPNLPDELRGPQELQQATALYNGMIHPLVPFAIRGAIWYQGESNMGDGMRYADRMKALIAGWRKVWNQGDFPFYFVQIAPFLYADKPPEMAPEIWEAQSTAAQTIPNTGMAVINDVGDLQDIHPQDKRTVGQRLALLALAKTYGESALTHSGPVFKSISSKGHQIRVEFDHAHGGLVTRDGKAPDWFEIIDAEEGGFVKAEARISGSSVILSSPVVKHPVAMRFAWSHVATPNLMNGKGLPAGAFRAAVSSGKDWLKSQVPEAKDYELVYDLDLRRLGPSISYEIDRHAEIGKPFDRIAYLLELQDANLRTRNLFVSMDAFTDDLSKIAIPTLTSGAIFQEKVTNLTAYSNVKGLPNGKNLSGGSIEFWPNNYTQANPANIPGASAERYDSGDQPIESTDGYGSMQVHHHGSGQTLFAINHWRDGLQADVGIGSQATGEPDWTFAKNASSYRSMRLKVLVRIRR
ncbi:MAG: 9-O-acetylesterase [Verrucomicrobia bacterium]|nr:MAG: 9-O-acetylesterase [Verrucomicrobiota bacterium]TAE89108.1 MAG: 9-O-acetylesterase [Verrucomicrobiota bacterium]TAF28019.1 MAG: 9-O-acetylesterase [Verrucomicrobiota bacterium]TAF42866.1 MAG: 9-O-acetylesterase [Verrucomicrobiota bacterium]